MKRAIAILLGVVAAPLPAAGQSVDFLDQSVTVDVTGDELHVVVDLHVRATGPADTLAFFDPSIPLTSLEVEGVPVEVEPDAQYRGMVSWATWPESLQEGDEAHLTMVLDGEPDCSSPYYPGAATCTHRSDETVLFPSSAAMAWSFVSLFEMDPFTSTIVVRAPASHEVAAGQGAPVSVVDGEDDTRTWTFSADVPTEQLVVYARAGEVLRAGEEVPVAIYWEGGEEGRAAAQGLADFAAEILPIESEMYGPIGLDEFHLLMFSDYTPWGGMGVLGNVLLQEFVLDDEFAYIREQGIAHELAHGWWGGLATGADYTEGAFLSEAFAEYSAWRAIGTLRGEGARTSGVRMNAIWYMLRRPDDEDIAVLDPDTAESPVYVFVTYHKGSVVLRTIEAAAGAEGFAEALRTFLARGGGGLTVDALVEDVLAATGYDASADVEQWLRATGYPTVEVALEPTAEGALVHTRTDGEFSFSLPVAMRLADGTVERQTLALAPGEQEHPLVLPREIVLAEVDPEWTAVRRIVPSLDGDVTLDGRLDALDLIEVALRSGTYLPEERRVDGGYDPLYDVDDSERVDRDDLEWIVAEAGR